MAMLWLAKTAIRRVVAQQPAVRCLGSLTCASSLDASAPGSVVVPCGRGDKKTKRGKRFKGSYGNARGKKKTMIQRIKDRVEVPRSTPWPLPFRLI